MGLTDISRPVSVARSVLEHSPHNVLCGAGATQWGLARGFGQVTPLPGHYIFTNVYKPYIDNRSYLTDYKL